MANPDGHRVHTSHWSVSDKEIVHRSGVAYYKVKPSALPQPMADAQNWPPAQQRPPFRPSSATPRLPTAPVSGLKTPKTPRTASPAAASQGAGMSRTPLSDVQNTPRPGQAIFRGRSTPLTAGKTPSQNTPPPRVTT